MDTVRRAPMHLCVFLMGSCHYHDQGWRHPAAYTDLGSNFERIKSIAQKADEAEFDILFIADLISPLDFDNPDLFRRASRSDRFDPVTLLAALSTVTSRIGLAATVVTSYSQPYDVARKLASLDLISGGRAAWNIVTGNAPEDAAQYGNTYDPEEERYARGEEFVDVVTALWDSVEADAFPRDKAAGIYAYPEKIHEIEHKGKYYSVQGPLSVAKSPQGRPILVQAGQSVQGKAFASRVADVIFTAQNKFENAKAFYADIHTRTAAVGRDPNMIRILPGVVPVVGRTREEAKEKEELLNAFLEPIDGLAKIKKWLGGFDLSGYPLDEPFPELPASATVSRGTNYVEMARREGLTLREVLKRASVGNAHLTITGTAVDVADQLEHWYRNGAADGFNLLCPTFPSSFDDFITLVMPELRRRGLLRAHHAESTLRANLGIGLKPIPRRSPV